MAHNLEEVNFEDKNGELIQGCTIRKSNIKNASNYYEITCITCKQTNYCESEFEQGKIAALHFLDRVKYPIK